MVSNCDYLPETVSNICYKSRNAHPRTRLQGEGEIVITGIARFEGLAWAMQERIAEVGAGMTTGRLCNTMRNLVMGSGQK